MSLNKSKAEDSNGRDHAYRQRIDDRYKRSADAKAMLAKVAMLRLIGVVGLLVAMVHDYGSVGARSPWTYNSLFEICAGMLCQGLLVMVELFGLKSTKSALRNLTLHVALSSLAIALGLYSAVWKHGVGAVTIRKFGLVLHVVVLLISLVGFRSGVILRERSAVRKSR